MKSRIPPVDKSTSFLRQYLNEQKLALQQVINNWRNYHLTKHSDHAKDILLKKFAIAQKLTTSENDADQLFEKVLEQNYQENRMEED